MEDIHTRINGRSSANPSAKNRAATPRSSATAKRSGRAKPASLDEQLKDLLAALRAARELLVDGGRLIFDVFRPSQDDIDDTDGRWIEREPGIDERADWDLEEQTLTLSVRGAAGETTMQLWWLEPERWLALLGDAGFAVEHVYGWFDRRPYRGGEDTVFVARRA